MRDHDTAAWADAVDVDSALRIGIRGIIGEVYLHRCSVALDAADLRRPPIAASSISGRTKVRGCAGCSVSVMQR